MDFQPSAKCADYLERVKTFMREHIEPAEGEYFERVFAGNHGGDWRRWEIPPVMEALKAKARKAGLWNMFLPDDELGAGLSVLEYAPIAEQTGRSFIAPEVFNCSAPDTGNMEVIWRYGSPDLASDELHAAVEATLLDVFAEHDSPSVQSSIWLMARAILERHEEVAEVRMALPNLHHWLADLSPFGLANDNEIFIATTEPHGLIEATVRRGEG